jgi:hydroxymethylpyrimidine kinase / phosphomethylpyrimidine kinase / thiamine-phosphate diphosphorylase
MFAVMTIAGSDSGGGAGAQADARTFAACGVFGTSVITAVTAQNTLGVLEVYDLPVRVVVAQMQAVFSDINVRCVKTGMLATAETAEAVVNELVQHKTQIVVDPVMAAETGGQLLIGELKEVLSRLLPEATVTTPNVREAEAISGVAIRSIDDMKRAAVEIYAKGPQSVIVTGGHLTGTDVLYDGEFEMLRGRLIKTGTHGAGCTFSASVAAFLAKGYSVCQSAFMAKSFVRDAIKESEVIGSGAGVVNQVARTSEMAARYLAVLDVEAALRTIKTINLDLIPDVGSNLAVAISGAKKLTDVAAVKGRIVRDGQVIKPAGCVAFGASRNTARAILAASRYDASIKSAMNVQCSDDFLAACQELNLYAESFERTEKLEGMNRVESGMARAIERGVAHSGAVPDVIYGQRVGKERKALVFGHSAQQVGKTMVKISSKL